jgi:hypothetical protein
MLWRRRRIREAVPYFLYSIFFGFIKIKNPKNKKIDGPKNLFFRANPLQKATNPRTMSQQAIDKVQVIEKLHEKIYKLIIEFEIEMNDDKERFQSCFPSCLDKKQFEKLLKNITISYKKYAIKFDEYRDIGYDISYNYENVSDRTYVFTSKNNDE